MTRFTELIVVALVSSSSSSTCPCWPNGGKINDMVCDDRSLTSIPTCVSSNITTLSVNTPSIPLDADTFKRFTKLPRLNIKYFKKPKISKGMFKSLNNLEEFEISKTGLHYIHNKWFMYAPQIRTVALNRNKLKYLAPDAFSYLPVLETVRLEHNHLASLSPEVFRGTALKTLFLRENPWRCECDMAKFMQWTKDTGVKIVDEPLCAQPQQFKGLNLKSLAPSHSCTWPYN